MVGEMQADDEDVTIKASTALLRQQRSTLPVPGGKFGKPASSHDDGDPKTGPSKDTADKGIAPKNARLRVPVGITPPAGSAGGKGDSFPFNVSAANSVFRDSVKVGVDHSAAFSAAIEIFRGNPALSLAVPIFERFMYVQTGGRPGDVSAFHSSLTNALVDYEKQVLTHGIPPRHASLLLYALAATIDDVILNTSWGKDSAWATKSLISLFFRETWGGERFFALLAEMMGSGPKFVQEIEVYYFCLIFGFAGKYRLNTHDGAELGRIREEIGQFLRETHGTPRSELSPTWRPVAVERRGLRDFLPFWLGCMGVVILLLLLFIIPNIVLQRNTTLTVREVESLVSKAVPIRPSAPPPVQPAAIAAAPAEPPPPAVVQSPFEVVSGMLQPQQAAGLLRVTMMDGRVAVVTTQELFASGSTNLNDPYPRVMQAVAAALDGLPGTVTVIGYTDNVGVRPSARFPNNLVLSTLRAQEVARVIAQGLEDPSRVSYTGRGADNPIAPNTTPEGRLANRRVEIFLTAQ